MRTTRALLVATAFFVGVVANGADITLTVEPRQVIARGVTPLGEVVFFGRTHEYIGGTPHLGSYAVVERDADGDGVVVMTVDDPLPRYSVWVGVDQTDGRYVVAGPPDAAPRALEFSLSDWKDGAGTIDVSHAYLDFLLVRPGKGAWRLDILQGSARDEDGKVDATLRARISALRHLTGKEQAPPHASKKDVLAIIDPRTLEVFVKAAQ